MYELFRLDLGQVQIFKILTWYEPDLSPIYMYILLSFFLCFFFLGFFFMDCYNLSTNKRPIKTKKKKKKEFYVFAYAKCACCSVKSLIPAPLPPINQKKKTFVIKPNIKLPSITKLIHRRKTEKTKRTKLM